MLPQFVINSDDGTAILKSPKRYIVTTKHSIFEERSFMMTIRSCKTKKNKQNYNVLRSIIKCATCSVQCAAQLL